MPKAIERLPDSVSPVCADARLPRFPLASVNMEYVKDVGAVETSAEEIVKAPLVPAVCEANVSEELPFVVTTEAVTPMLLALMAAANPAIELSPEESVKVCAAAVPT